MIHRTISTVIGESVYEISFMDFSPPFVSNVEVFDKETRTYFPLMKKYRMSEEFRAKIDNAVGHHILLMEEIQADKELVDDDASEELYGGNSYSENYS